MKTKLLLVTCAGILFYFLFAITADSKVEQSQEPKGIAGEVGRIVIGAVIGEVVREVVEAMKKPKPSRPRPRPEPTPPSREEDPYTGGPAPMPTPAPGQS